MNQTARTFSTSEEALQYLQGIYGSTNYRDWQSVRKQFYSYVQYPTAGQVQTNFFGSIPGSSGITTQDTNVPAAGNFAQNHFLLMAVRMDIRVPNVDFDATQTVDADTLYCDYVGGLVQAGMLSVTIGDKAFLQIPRPLMYCPPADGSYQAKFAGARSGALPNQVSVGPNARLTGGADNLYVLDPAILIEAGQTFAASLNYQTGAVPVIATDVVNDTTNPMSIGLIFDGILYRPVQ